LLGNWPMLGGGEADKLEQDRLPNKGFAGAVFAIKAKGVEGAHV
jgi:hypothetical protein